MASTNKQPQLMKFSGFLEIRKPKAEVAAHFADPESYQHYQDGFVSKTLNSGTYGQEGAISTIYFKQGKRDMVLTETVQANNLPDSFDAFYHHKHMDNTMKVRFVEIDANTTRYEYEFEYLRINWLLPKLIAILFPGMYRKQGEKWMKQFKSYVEST